MTTQRRRTRRPNGVAPDPVRSVRVSDLVWEKARRRANSEGVTMSRVVALIIEGYADGYVNLPRVHVSYGAVSPGSGGSAVIPDGTPKASEGVA